ncbi:hypothetical protein E3N88_09462 [Mikania micrantha]|uniref:Uncharacterized protein n=1 Tax=Mikania micrantha TaxID=192012 RepID=A0A5N6PLB7_9ASTR|nr:hypothetical protein E3N88_09462 [Mikania micrantha]
MASSSSSDFSYSSDSSLSSGDKDTGETFVDRSMASTSSSARCCKCLLELREAKFIQKIVTEISLKLHPINWSIDEKLVGMEERVKNVISSLEVESEDDVRVIGIWGMGGAGKTTLARAIFDHISIWFEGKSFVENVRERSKGMGLKELQRQLLKDVLNDQSIDVAGVFDGKNMMKRMMLGRKVLVVLDDVDGIEQLEALAGEKKKKAIRILESCGFHAQIGLEVLEQKSLINISYDGCLGMHDHIEEMGKNIVRRLHPDEPSRHSRLWVKEEIEEILFNDLGTEATSMNLKNPYIHSAIVMKGLRKMKKIRLLSVTNDIPNKWDKNGGVQYLPDTLRSLCWARYPFCCLPKTFQAKNLVNLEMPGSNISQLWEGGEREVLELMDCFYLQEIHAPMGCLKNLTHLKLSGCLIFEDFSFYTPYFSYRVNSLATLKLNAKSLDRCSLHPNSNFPKLKFECEYKEVLPLLSGNLEKLLSFGLCACTNLDPFSASICGLQHLTTLTLEGCIPELPKNVWKLESLEQLTLLE